LFKIKDRKNALYTLLGTVSVSLYSETDMKSGNYQSHRLSNFYCLWHNAGHEIADYHFKRFSCDYSDISFFFVKRKKDIV